MVGTGTGVAPLVAMLGRRRTSEARVPTVLIHGASFADELGFRERLVVRGRVSGLPLDYRPTVSRPEMQRNYCVARPGGSRRARNSAALWMSAVVAPVVSGACAAIRDGSRLFGDFSWAARFAAADIRVEPFHATRARPSSM